jgi:site-specific DNA recombinase
MNRPMIDQPDPHEAPARPLTDISGLERLARKTSAGPVNRTPISPKQAVLYLRVSTERQMHTAADIDADGNSIAMQRDLTLKRASGLKARSCASL